MSNFNTSKESVQDNLDAPFLNKTGMFGASLTKLYPQEFGDENEWEVLTFEFNVKVPSTGKDGEQELKTYKFSHSFFPPAEDATPEEVQKTVGLIGYTLKYFLKEPSAAIGITAENWNEFRNKVAEVFSKVGDSTIEREMKITGYVGKNGPTLTLPNYKGFLRRYNDKDKTLDFSKREIQNNNKYRNALTQASDSNESLEESIPESADARGLF